MTDQYRYRIYKRGLAWFVRKRRKSNASTVIGYFDRIEDAWSCVRKDVDRRRKAVLHHISRDNGGKFHGADT